jgi:hypothetical protein
MGKCFDNIRQLNEKGEDCAKRERDVLENMMSSMKIIYSEHSKRLNECTMKCKSEEDIKCLINCSKSFKISYHNEVEKVIDGFYNKLSI